MGDHNSRDRGPAPRSVAQGCPVGVWGSSALLGAGQGEIVLGDDSEQW